MLATKNYVDFQILDPITRIPLAEWKGAAKANHALPEDTVRMTDDGTVEILERAEKKPLVGVLHLTSKYMYGMTSHNVPMYLCEPMNKGYPSFRVACKERDRSRNLLVSFQFESWEAGSELPRGGLLQVLGPVEDPRAEAEALAVLSCPWSAPRPKSTSAVVESYRRVLSKGTFNIDPVGCKDIDDVLTLEKLETGEIRLWITIADVAERLDPTNKEFQVAEKIGSTSYQEGFAVRPMLHKDLSERDLSLIPGEQRYGLALRVDWSAEKGFMGNPEFEKVMVINETSYTYESIYKSDRWIQDTLAHISSDMAGKKLTDSHDWIEQFMLFYNRQAALILRQVGAGLLRVHDEPVFEKQRILSTIHPGLEYLAYKAAAYAPVSSTKTHWGLSLESYCHASSPIRRFADIINQQIIKDWLDKKTLQYSESVFERLAVRLNDRQKQIQAAEREYCLLKVIQQAEKAIVEARYLWATNRKAEFYVEGWKTTIRFPYEKELVPGKVYSVQYYCDRRKASWKERMIYRLVEDSVVQ
jgi:exoribonuclease R